MCRAFFLGATCGLNGVDDPRTILRLQEDGDTLGSAFIRLLLSMKALPWEREVPSVESAHPGELRLRLVPLEGAPSLLVGPSAICEHLEETYRRFSFLPDDAEERAFVRRTLEMVRPLFGIARRPPEQLGIATGTPEEAAQNADELARLQAALTELDALLIERKSTGAYAVGNSASLTDLLVVVLARAVRSRGAPLTPYVDVQRIFASVGQMSAVELAYGRRRGALLDDMRPELRDRYITRVHEVLEPISGQMRLLEAIAWPRAAEEEFFSSGASRLPQIEATPDRDTANAAIAALSGLLHELDADHVLVEWLRAQVQSFIDAYRMLLAVGTRNFYALSLELYGGARTTAFDRNTTNLDLAAHVEKRLGQEARFVETDALDTAQFVAFLEQKLAARRPALDLKIIVDPNLSSKVICGRTRLRVREGAQFSWAEAEGLWLHEVETHALTAQNGAAQKFFPLLKAGGPRATRTQEGLAVFAELYGHAMSSPRLARIAQRVRLVGEAEDGADFLDLYRGLVERGAQPRDAYQDAARICRGGLVTGGAPFTKDACYLAGLVDVYSLFRSALRFRSPLLGELLVTGRIHSNDLVPLLWLREQGVVQPPRFVPSWVERWDGLLSYFAFTSFLNEIDLNLTLDMSSETTSLIERAVARYDETRHARSSGNDVGGD